MHLITDNIQKLFNICRKYKVGKLYAFGSILTDRFNDSSDVDILVDFSPKVTYLTYDSSDVTLILWTRAR